jgi:tRNA threonylcarbamoyladenosine biosynthesis protein TsaE
MPPDADPIDLPTEAATGALAACIGARLRPGDTLLLEGGIGAGKTAFARALIRAATGNPGEEVPSPTFTLVQTYPSPQGKIWHADLYRLTHPDEARELGLAEAMENAICLVEWPDRLGDLTPDGALTLSFEALPLGPHRVRLSGPPPWSARLEPCLAD